MSSINKYLLIGLAIVGLSVFSYRVSAQEVDTSLTEPVAVEQVNVEQANTPPPPESSTSSDTTVMVTTETSTTTDVSVIATTTETTTTNTVSGENTTTTTVTAAAVADALASPQLSSAKDDYHPGETATIFGKFFQSLKPIILKIFGSDEHDGNYTESTQTITPDANGAFSVSYNLDSLYRPFYEMVASSLDGTKLASGWFRDSSVGTYDQCSNDDGDGYASGDTGCRWTNGNIQSSNSTYFEGDTTVQRLWLEGYAPGSSHTVTFKYGTTKAGKHAYDYLTNWNASENWVTLADRCQDITGCNTASESTFAMQNDPNVTDTIEPAPASRAFTIRGGTITNVSVPTIVSGTYAGDSETSVTVTFTVGPSSGAMCTTKQSVTSCGVAIWFGAHIADSQLWNTFNQTTGAGSISGSPYHVALDQEDGASIGQRDNQMAANAIIVTGSITIIKDAVPNDAQNFSFTTTGTGLGNFTLDDDADPTLSNTQVFSGLSSGTYTVTEGAVSGWALTNLSCVDPTTNSTVNLGTRTATIDLAAGENITCTFTNTLQAGHLVVQKTTVPAADATVFSINTTGTGTITGGGAGSISDALDKVYDVTAGTYSVAETVPAGWTKTGDTCQNVVVSAGATSTCLITNTKNATLTLVKTVVNNNGGTATASNFQAKIDGGNVPWNVAQTISTGVHTVSETNLPGYSAGAWGGDCATNGAVTINPGDAKVCTITNDDIAPTLKIIKNTLNGNGTFNFVVSGPTASTPSIVTTLGTGTTGTTTVSAGTYSVKETIPSGWGLTSASCTDGSSTFSVDTVSGVAIGLGENVVCTFTNAKPDAKIVLTPATAVNNIHDPHTITATVYKNDGTSTTTAAGATVNFSLLNNTASAAFVGANSCVTDANGQCSVDINSSTSGDVDIHGTVTLSVIGVSLTRASGDGFSGDSADAHKTYVAGALSVAKVIDLGAYPFASTTNKTFTINVTGPSYPSGTALTFHVVDGLITDSPQTLTQLIPGAYTVIESDPGIAWTVVGGSNDVNVVANQTATSTVTNVLKQPHTTASFSTSEATTTVGSTVTLNISDTNDGAVALTNPSMSLVYGTTTINLDKTHHYVSGDSNNDGIMDPGETWNWSVVVAVTSSTSFVASGHGFDPLGNDIAPPHYATEKVQVAVTAVDAHIALSPLTASNEVGDDHVITVTVKQDLGNGIFVNATDGTLVTFSLSNSNGATATFNGGINTCNTVAGACTVTINSPTSGTVSINASTAVSVAGLSLTRDTDPATASIGAGPDGTGPAAKNYVDGKITLTPATAINNINVPHVITATVTENPGTGTIAASGTLVTFSLNNNTAGASFVAGNTCTTAANGQCSVSINSATPGSVKIHATATFTVNGITITRASDSTHGSSADVEKTYVAGKIIVKKITNPSSDTTTQFAFNTTGTGYNGFTLVGGGQNDSGNLATGTYAVSEGAVSGWQMTNATCDNNQTPANITLAAGQTVTCTFTNTKLGSLTIVKDAQPNDLIGFDFTANNGLTPASFTLVDDGTNTANKKVFTGVVAGAYTIGETQPNSYWTSGGISCTDTDANAPYTNITKTASSVTVNLTAGKNVSCTFVNVKQSPTRTLGFWQTHTAFTQSVLAAAPISGNLLIGDGALHKGPVNTAGKVFGGFFASIPKTTDGKKRTNVDQARIQVLQQLIAAKLNCAAFGCSSAVQTMIVGADAAYASGDVGQIKSYISQLDAYNNSGDTLKITATGSATPSTSKSLADLAFWDTP